VKKYKSILLIIATLAALFLLFSCGNAADQPPEDNGDTGAGDLPDEIIIPESDDFGRDVLHFDRISYKRPDTNALLLKFGLATEMINAASAPFSVQLDAVREVMADYEDFSTLYSYITVKHKGATDNSFYRNEYDFLFKADVSFVEALEDLCVAAALSPYAERFEEEYFGDELTKKYGGGDRYSDKMISLLKSEAELKKRYSGLSPKTVTVTCDGIYGSYEAVLRALNERYANKPAMLSALTKSATRLYEEHLAQLKKEIFISLLQVRRLIADEMGFETYTAYIYSETERDYTVADYEKFLKDISDYAIPVYRKLYNLVFMNYLKGVSVTEISTADTVNIFGQMLRENSEELSAVYDYMLCYGLFDIEQDKKTRQSESFTLYLDNYSTPVSFVSLSGGVDGFLTLAHEFGNFYDAFVNFGDGNPTDIASISPVALELLSVLRLRDHITEKDYKYLLYSSMNNMLLTLIHSGFYAEFEQEAYKLSYNEITEERLFSIASGIAEKMSLNPDIYGDLSDVLISDLFENPLNMQTMTTSATVALEIFFSESANEGAGLKQFLSLVKRDNGVGFDETLHNARIPSPFESEQLKDIANKIHYTILGSYFYNSDGGGIVA